jgi:hypothetical protein
LPGWPKAQGSADTPTTQEARRVLDAANAKRAAERAAKARLESARPINPNFPRRTGGVRRFARGARTPGGVLITMAPWLISRTATDDVVSAAELEKLKKQGGGRIKSVNVGGQVVWAPPLPKLEPVVITAKRIEPKLETITVTAKRLPVPTATAPAPKPLWQLLLPLLSPLLSGSKPWFLGGPSSGAAPRPQPSPEPEPEPLPGLTTITSSFGSFGESCDCPPKRKKSSKPACTNKLVSKTNQTKGSQRYQIVKRRITCPSSLEKLRLRRTRR